MKSLKIWTTTKKVLKKQQQHKFTNEWIHGSRRKVRNGRSSVEGSPQMWFADMIMTTKRRNMPFLYFHGKISIILYDGGQQTHTHTPIRQPPSPHTEKLGWCVSMNELSKISTFLRLNRTQCRTLFFRFSFFVVQWVEGEGVLKSFPKLSINNVRTVKRMTILWFYDRIIYI